jgi:ferredoxin-NADP reductase
MVRHWASAGSEVPVRLLYSARTVDEIIYRDELRESGADVRYTLTRGAPEGWSGYRGRIDRALLTDVAWPPGDRPQVYVCGPNGFVESAAEVMVGLGHDPALIRTERFGPTGT